MTGPNADSAGHDSGEESALAAGDSSATPARIGANEWGRISIGSKVVEKIAARAAVEIPDAGGAAARLLGQVTEAVRQHLFRRLAELVGLHIREVNIEIVDLVSDTSSARVS